MRFFVKTSFVSNEDIHKRAPHSALGLTKQRTAKANPDPWLVAEYGLVAPKEMGMRRALPCWLEYAENGLMSGSVTTERTVGESRSTR